MTHRLRYAVQKEPLRRCPLTCSITSVVSLRLDPGDSLCLFAAAPPITAQRHLCVGVSIASAPNACTCQGISIDYQTAAATSKRDFSAATPPVHDCYLPVRLIEVFERPSSCCIVDASAVVLIPGFQQHATRTAYTVALLHLHLQHPCSVQPCSLLPEHLLCICKLLLSGA
jgi:hypothetical protein